MLEFHMTGDESHEEVRRSNGSGAGSPEYRWLCAVRRQGQSPSAGGHQGLGNRSGSLGTAPAPDGVQVDLLERNVGP